MNGGPRIKIKRFQTPEEIAYDRAQVVAAGLIHENGLMGFDNVIGRLSKMRDCRRMGRLVKNVVVAREKAVGTGIEIEREV